jgi:hypothetical protein
LDVAVYTVYAVYAVFGCRHSVVVLAAAASGNRQSMPPQASFRKFTTAVLTPPIQSKRCLAVPNPSSFSSECRFFSDENLWHSAGEIVKEQKQLEETFVLPAAGKRPGEHQWTPGSDVQSLWKRHGWTPPSQKRSASKNPAEGPKPPLRIVRG